MVARGSQTPQKILITGAAGLLGTVLMRGLEGRYELVGVDRALRRPANVRRRNLARSRFLGSIFEGADAVVDLAGLPDHTTDWKHVWRNNLPATMNALEAARRAGVRRYVFASSNHVTGLYERHAPYSAIVAGDYAGLDPGSIPLIGARFPVRPDGAYALGKVLGEAAARWYSETSGLSAICLRIGTVNAEDRPLQPRHFATLLTHADLLRLVECALEAPVELGFRVYYGVSRNTWRFWDIADAAIEIDYDPQDDAEDLRR
ncbi:MAG TPA: NAD(P)-dependent oxidoreductase [Gaiellaceae bacterium]|nr:NAD(P)-dependent oxidoreductase [Gaiellaceae bacterium]